MIKLLEFILASCFSGILYRMGGADPPYQSWMRDYPCSLINALLLCLLGGFSFNLGSTVAIILTLGLQIGAYSSYWMEKKYYSLHTIGLCLALIPWIIYSHHWLGFAIRLVAIPLVVLWSSFISKQPWEEIGRGIIITLTIPLLFIK